MHETLPQTVYGDTNLAKVYQGINRLKIINAQIDYECINYDRQSIVEYGEIEQEYHQQKSWRSSCMLDIEQQLLEASSDSWFSRETDGVSVCIAYATYLGMISCGLKDQADDLIFKVTSMLPGVPIITNAYGTKPNGGIVQESPLIQLTQTQQQEYFDWQQSRLELSGQVWIARKNRVQNYQFNLPNINNLVIGSAAINAYVDDLFDSRSLTSRVKLDRIKSSFERIYTPPDVNRTDDQLLGQIEF